MDGAPHMPISGGVIVGAEVDELTDVGRDVAGADVIAAGLGVHVEGN